MRYDSSQSSSITDSFSDALSFHADLLTDAGKDWIREINVQLTQIEKAAAEIGNLAANLGRACGQSEEELRSVSNKAEEQFNAADRRCGHNVGLDGGARNAVLRFWTADDAFLRNAHPAGSAGQQYPLASDGCTAHVIIAEGDLLIMASWLFDEGGDIESGMDALVYGDDEFVEKSAGDESAGLEYDVEEAAEGVVEDTNVEFDEGPSEVGSVFGSVGIAAIVAAAILMITAAGIAAARKKRSKSH